MTREELLEKIDRELSWMDAESWHNGARALRAVVELHKEYTTSDSLKFCVICTRTEDKWEYPCETIQAIEKELQYD